MLILASKSPRRRELLQAAGIPFEIRTKEVEEDFPDDMPAEEVPLFLALKKAEACADLLQSDDEILLTADSDVILEGVVLGKPQDYDHAFQMLKALSGKMHKVVTGVCLQDRHRKVCFAETSKVYFNPISDAEIDRYIRASEPFDKAGGYGIQEWIGVAKIAKIEGNYYNIVGLPVSRVWEILDNWQNIKS